MNDFLEKSSNATRAKIDLRKSQVAAGLTDDGKFGCCASETQDKYRRHHDNNRATVVSRQPYTLTLLFNLKTNTNNVRYWKGLFVIKAALR